MRHKVPLFGPHAGKLCRVAADGTLEPAPEPTEPLPPPVALPDWAGGTADPVASGELAGFDTRNNREALRRSIVEHGGSEAWAAEKASRAVTNWDRGVREGRIARKRS